MRDMTHSHSWHVSFTFVTCFIHVRDMAHAHVHHVTNGMLASLVTAAHAWHVSFKFVTWLVHMLDMSHSGAWQVSFTCVAWLMPTSSRYQRDARKPHDCHTCVTLLIHISDMTHSHAWHDSFTCDMTHVHRHHVTNSMLVSPVTATRAWHDSFAFMHVCTEHILRIPLASLPCDSNPPMSLYRLVEKTQYFGASQTPKI